MVLPILSVIQTQRDCNAMIYTYEFGGGSLQTHLQSLYEATGVGYEVAQGDQNTGAGFLSGTKHVSPFQWDPLEQERRQNLCWLPCCRHPPGQRIYKISFI